MKKVNPYQKVIDFNMTNVYAGRSKKGYGFTYYAIKDFKKGETVMMGEGKILDHQTDHCSVQIKVDTHYLPTKWTGRYWNHSCDANTYMKTRSDGFPALVAARDIKKDEEITFSYWMSEYKWVSSADENHIKCSCGEKKCKGKIYSFSQLSPSEQKMLVKSGHCSAYLQKLV